MILTHTAETVPECDEAIDNLRAALASADGERRDLIRELLDSALDRRLELTAHGCD